MSYTFWHYCPSDNVKLFFSSDIIFFSSLWFLTVPDESMNLEIKLISSFKVAFHVSCMRVQHSEKKTSQNRMHVIGRCFFSIVIGYFLYECISAGNCKAHRSTHKKMHEYTQTHTNIKAKLTQTIFKLSSFDAFQFEDGRWYCCSCC